MDIPKLPEPAANVECWMGGENLRIGPPMADYAIPMFTADQLRSRDEMWAKRVREMEAFISRARAESELIELHGRTCVAVPYWFMRGPAAAIREEKNL